MDTTLLREITIEIAELQRDFDARILSIHRKLRIALGDVKPAPKMTELVGWDGKARTIKKREKPRSQE